MTEETLSPYRRRQEAKFDRQYQKLQAETNELLTDPTLGRMLDAAVKTGLLAEGPDARRWAVRMMRDILQAALADPDTTMITEH